MSATVDANVLLYASYSQSPYRDRAIELINDVARGPQIFYLFWPTVMAYLRLATHPSIFARPMSLAEARSNVSRLLELPNVQTGGESARFWDRFDEVADDASPRGNLVLDAPCRDDAGAWRRNHLDARPRLPTLPQHRGPRLVRQLTDLARILRRASGVWLAR
ncbi:MAG: TA system VapC family ribonuclease toxin [Candidatus Limnocylindria bacterium]